MSTTEISKLRPHKEVSNPGTGAREVHVSAHLQPCLKMELSAEDSYDEGRGTRPAKKLRAVTNTRGDDQRKSAQDIRSTLQRTTTTTWARPTGFARFRNHHFLTIFKITMAGPEFVTGPTSRDRAIQNMLIQHSSTEGS